ncbi:MAG: hypothetical protein H7Z74_12620 [Anaerolineae bacterium]|nr:hypothetical protein [Gemmatimonadaceae bacterium]
MRALRTAFSGSFWAGIMAVCVAGGLDAQLQTGPLKNVHGCLRPDVEKSKEAIRKAMQSGKEDEAVEVQKEVKGCIPYTITFQSAVSVISTSPPGGTRKITGRGSITFGLTSDPSEPEFDLTSGPSELTAPVYWTDAAITVNNKCIVRTIALPYSAFSFWLGVKSGARPQVATQISPAGDELHATFTKCPKPYGGWTNEVPGRDMIFSPAWTALHAQGMNALAGAAPTPMGPQGMDMKKMEAMAAQAPGQGMDMKKMQAMADKLKGKDPTPEDMAEMMKAMGQVVPNADKQLEAARNNFRFKMPGDCVPAAGLLARCTINRTVTVPDGLGTNQTITESTVITIAKGTAAAKP